MTKALVVSGKGRDLDELSKPETSLPTDSDAESDYVTGLEDFPDNSTNTSLCPGTRDMLNFLSDPSRTSAFIQSILYEDSCAGVAVVDLFVAVKMVKDKMDFLARSNNDVLEKITNLNRDTRVIRAGYKNLIDSMREFLNVITEEKANQSVVNEQCQRQESGDEQFPARETLSIELEIVNKTHGEQCLSEKCKDEFYFWGKEGVEGNMCDGCATEGEGTKRAYLCLRHQKGMDEWKLDCLGCLLSIFSKKAQTQAPILNEALLGSFIASLLWLQKKKEGLCVPRINSKMISQMQEEIKKKEGGLNLSESCIQMICDICEILGGKTSDLVSGLGEEFEPKASNFDEDAGASNETTCDLTSSDQTEDDKIPSEGDHSVPGGKEVTKSTEDTGSEGESVFEEALTEFPHPSEVRQKHNVTCMGDLSSNIVEKKNVSTFTANNDTMSSWIGKFTNDIKTKIKKMKSKANVTIVERPYLKSNRTLKKLAGAFEFAITASTPVGVFDVTVLQYQKRRRSKDLSKRIGKLVQGLRSKEPLKHRPLPVRTANIKEDDYLENDIHDSDSESVEGSFNSGEDDFEDFMDIYVENSNKNEEAVTPIPEKYQLKTLISKFPILPYFEIKKCYPIYFVQEVIPKILTKVPSVQSNVISTNEEEVVSINASETQQKEVVIQRSSSDLVIYIQLEVDDGQTSSSGELFVEYQTSSHSTQTRNAPLRLPPIDEKVIKLREAEQNGDSLFNIWRGCETETLLRAGEKEKAASDESFVVTDDQELEIREDDLEEAEERLIAIQESKERPLSDSLSDVFTEREIQEIHLVENEKFSEKGNARVISIMNAKRRADVWYLQKESTAIERGEIMNPQMWHQNTKEDEKVEYHIINFVRPIVLSNVELEKALKLISEIESDVIDVKLSDAISILPQFESELRKHLQNKMKKVETDSDKKSSVETFFSAVDFWPYDHSVHADTEDSEEKLHSLLKLLSDLEEAVKETEYSNNKLDLCDCDSSVIYKLLHELTNSIRELEENPNVMSLSQTLDIASQLDTAVRKYDSAVKEQSLGYVNPMSEKEVLPKPKSNCLENAQLNEQLKNVRKKVFDLVEEEAIDMEGRIERDFDRLDRLERENDEVLMFLEAFLQKTERRAGEFENLKTEMQNLMQSVSTLWERILRINAEREKKLLESKDRNSVSTQSSTISMSETVPVKDTISELLIALDSLKTRAKEKNELCKEILSSAGFEKVSESDISFRRSPRSSFTAKQVEAMTSTVKEFKKIGESSLYMSWTKPEASPSASVLGYEIHVNGTLNQKVRNPQRHQAVLYSVDLSREVEIHLFALLNTGPKVLLATLAYLDM